MPLANEYLGTTIFLSGTVFKGNNWQNRVTANIKIEEDYKLIPITVFMW
jgi:hypothetical protein